MSDQQSRETVGRTSTRPWVVWSLAVLSVVVFLSSFYGNIQRPSHHAIETGRQLTLRATLPRSASEDTLIPKLDSSTTSTTSPTRSSKWNFGSWLASFTHNDAADAPTEEVAPGTGKRTDKTDVRHNSNFVLSEGARRDQYAGNSSSKHDAADTKLFGKLTKAQCKAKYNDRHFLPVEKKKFPPMLYTFPGSGNTWCRLLIEYATGIYTGSVYNDQSLLSSLPGEFTCNSQVSAIKIHPHTHPFEGLRTGNFHSDATKCKRGGVDKIRRAVLLIRDPFDSIWSEFQRRITQSHVGGVLKANFDWPRWQANAAALSHQYHLMWAVHHAGIEKHFAAKDYLYLKYEDLKNKSTRVDTLQRVSDFLGLSSPSRERLECAFALADNRETHRVVDPALTMSKEEAYTIPLACRMWALLGAHASKHGYRMWRDLDCSQLAPGTTAGPIAKGEGGALAAVPAGGGTKGNVYPPIPRVNVGGQGEYDRRWVQPGQPLLDFFGHPTAQPAAAPVGPGAGPGRKHGPRAVKKITPGGVGGSKAQLNQQKQIPSQQRRPGQTPGQADGSDELDKTNQWMRYQAAPLPVGANAVQGPAAAAPGGPHSAPGSGGGLSAVDVASAIAAARARIADREAPQSSQVGPASPSAQSAQFQQPDQAGSPAAGGGKKGPAKGQGAARLSGWFLRSPASAEEGDKVLGATGKGVQPLAPPPPQEQAVDGGSASAMKGTGKGKGGPAAARGEGRPRKGRGGGPGGGGGGGMTLEQASQEGAVLASVGADKPAWQ